MAGHLVETHTHRLHIILGVIELPTYECPFRLGDTVIPIAPSDDEANRPPFWVDEMEEFLGREAKVVRIATMSNFYILKLDISGDYNWRDTWLKFVRVDYTLF